MVADRLVHNVAGSKRSAHPPLPSPLLAATQVVGHNRGRSSPWSSMLPDAHDVLPAFMEEVSLTWWGGWGACAVARGPG